MPSRRLARNGFDVVTAVDGQQGVDLAVSARRDLILTDMSLLATPLGPRRRRRRCGPVAPSAVAGIAATNASPAANPSLEQSSWRASLGPKHEGPREAGLLCSWRSTESAANPPLEHFPANRDFFREPRASEGSGALAAPANCWVREGFLDPELDGPELDEGIFSERTGKPLPRHARNRMPSIVISRPFMARKALKGLPPL